MKWSGLSGVPSLPLDECFLSPSFSLFPSLSFFLEEDSLLLLEDAFVLEGLVRSFHTLEPLLSLDFGFLSDDELERCFSDELLCFSEERSLDRL